MNNIKFKGFDLSAFFEFVSGNQLYNATRFTLERNRADGNITRNFYENYFRDRVRQIPFQLLPPMIMRVPAAATSKMDRFCG